MSKNHAETVEGEVSYYIPAAGKPCKTWYRVYGDLKGSTHRPLVILHGGPGFSHNYLLPLVDLTLQFGIPIVFYDQVGNGLSTHLQEKAGDEAFWTIELFIGEFHNLLSHLDIRDYDIFAHSFGGVIASEIAVRRPEGLHRLILASALASAESWREGSMILRKQLPQEFQDVLNKNEAAGTIDSKEYQEACEYYSSRFLCLIDPIPQDLADTFDWAAKDPTVYHTMWGRCEQYSTGSFKNWTIVDRLHQITAPTLLTNGRFDEAHDVTMKPFFEHIPKVRWFQFAESSHMAHFEERELFMKLVADFLDE